MNLNHWRNRRRHCPNWVPSPPSDAGIAFPASDCRRLRAGVRIYPIAGRAPAQP